MPAGLRVVPREHGPWLVVAGGRRLAVPAEIARRLQRNDAEDTEIHALAALLTDPDASPAGRSAGRSRPALWLRVPLIPGALVESVSRFLRPLASWPVLLGCVLLGCLAYALTLGGDWPDAAAVPVSRGGSILPAIILFLITALWHELGHAAALTRAGLPPGGIGAGVLFIVPVLFADVSAAHLLERPERLRVDVAGPAWQLLAGGGLVLAGRRLAWPGPDLASGFYLAGLAALAAVIWSALPFIRSDGYWFLCDALGVPDLDRPVTETRPEAGWLRPIAIIYRLFNTLFLLIVGVLLSWRCGSWLQVGAQRLSGRLPVICLLILLGVAGAFLLWRGLFGQVSRLLRSSWVDAKSLVSYHH